MITLSGKEVGEVHTDGVCGEAASKELAAVVAVPLVNVSRFLILVRLLPREWEKDKSA